MIMNINMDLNITISVLLQSGYHRKNLKTKRTVTIFERTFEKVEFGASVRKECDLYKDQIPAETLVLSFF